MKPQIRFKGFTDAWEQRKLGELGKAQSGIGFPDKEQGGKNGIPFFKVSDMNNLGNELEMHIANNYVSLEQIKKNGWSPIEETSVIFAKVGAAIMLNRKRLVRFPFLLDNNTMAYKFNDAWEIDFGRTLFERIDLTSLVQVGALPSYNAGDVENMEVAITQKAEQAKLGALFTSLDNLITLHQCKRAAFMSRKSPSIFQFEKWRNTLTWEQRKVSNMFKVTRGYVLAATLTSTDQSTETPYPVFSSQTKDKGLMGYYKDYLYKDAITWTTDGANAGTVNFRAGKFYCTNVCGVLLTDSVKASPAVAEALNNVAKRYVSYVGNPKLMNNVMADIEIHIPLVQNEQEKISQVFTTLDNLITLHQRKQNWQNLRFLRKISSLILAIAWEQRKLGAMAYRVNEMSAIEGLPRVEYEDIEAGQGTLNKNLKEKVSNKKGILFQHSDILYGKLRPYLKNWLFADFFGIAVGDFWVLRSNSVAHSFIYRLLQTPAFDYVANQSSGSKMPRADWKLVSNTEFSFPVSTEEQEKIGLLFLKLDNLITLHQCKRAAFMSRKSPSIFQFEKWRNTLTWEQRKVSNMFKVTRGYVLAATLTSTDQSTETPYPVFSSQTKDKGLMGYYKDYLYKDAITWTTDGANAGTVNFRAGKFYCTNVCGVLLTDSVKASPAVAEALNNVAKRYVSYVGNPKLMNNVMADIEIHIPLVQNEQEKISQVFTTLDNLITLHQRGENIYNRRQTW